MLSIGRGLMSLPKLLLLDEPSSGLAPLMVTTVFDAVKFINERGVSVAMVEQNVYNALEISEKAYVLENGKITLQGKGETLLRNESVKNAYLGI